jgi:cytochrome c-type protein NapB
MRILFIICSVLCLLLQPTYADNKDIFTLRQTPLEVVPEPPRMMPQDNKDQRKVRNYPEQPPVIPHKTEHYQVDAKVNQCMNCHARRAIDESNAPAVSITHYMDRDNQFLASVSPRRYFCNQCHVSQHEAKPLVENEFIDVEDIIKYLKDKK